LDIVQRDSCTVAEAVNAWKALIEQFASFAPSHREKVNNRYTQAVSPVWFVANILHPEYLGHKLSMAERKEAMEWVQNNDPGTYGNFVNFVGGDKDKFCTAYRKASGTKLKNFIECQRMIGELPDDLAKLLLKCLALRPSSAGIERIFSTMGFVHSDLRNRLSHEKVGKLAFCLRVLNEKSE